MALSEEQKRSIEEEEAYRRQTREKLSVSGKTRIYKAIYFLAALLFFFWLISLAFHISLGTTSILLFIFSALFVVIATFVKLLN